MSTSIILHVNAVEQGQSIEEMCRRAVEWGYDGIEFRRKRGGVAETPEAYLDEIARWRDRTGLKEVLFGGPGPNFMTADGELRRRELDECVAFYRAAARRFKLTLCNTMTGTLVAPNVHYFEFDRNGSNLATEEQWRWAVEGFQTLGDLAGELGFRFAFETHNCFIHDLAAPARKLVDRIDRPAVGINLDYGNIALHPQGGSLAEAVALCGDRIYEVHLKNLYKLPVTTYYNFIPCPLADGIINHREFLRLLKARAYAGPICIEQPREGDREWYSRVDLQYLRNLMGEVGWSA
jgi:sugar phosphate isomerase/epimerase